MTDRIIRPELVPEWPPLIRPLISNLSQGLCNLASANNGDLLGVALYHEVSRGSIGSPLTEYACAFVGTGDGRSCDGALSSLAPQTRRHVDSLKQGILRNGRPARLLDLALSNAGTTFETIHFADFTVAIMFEGSGFDRDVANIRIVATPALDARDADRRIAEIASLFAFLGEWHDILSRYSYELPTPDMLLRAA